MTAGVRHTGAEAGALAQGQLRLQGGDGGGYKALVLFDAYQVVGRLVHSVEAVLLHGSLVQGGHILVHQVVDGVIPEGVLSAVSFDLGPVGFALGKAFYRIGGAGALVHRIGCGFQLLSRGAKGHFADTLFGSFHTYQFHRITLRVAPKGVIF